MTRPDTACVHSFGARGDGVTDDAPFLQAALDSGAGEITLPPGSYKIGKPLRIGSNTRLSLDPQARIVLAANAGVDQTVHLLTNKDHEGGNTHIEICGGVWDGNNPANPRGPDAPGSYTGVAINFVNVRDLVLRDLKVVDPESFFIRLGEVREFLVEDVSFEAPNLRPNQDGIHLGGYCEDGVIRNVRAIGKGSTSDDMVAINADDAIHRVLNLGMKRGPIRRIRIDGLYAEDCHSFIRLASVWAPISDVSIANVRGGCSQYLVNADALRYCLTPIFDRNDPEYSGGVGLLERITLSDLEVHRTGGNQPLFLLETRMRDFTVRRFTRNTALDGNLSAPTFRLANLGESEVRLRREEEALLPGFVAGAEPGHSVARLACGQTLVSDLRGFEELSVSSSEAGKWQERVGD